MSKLRVEDVAPTEVGVIPETGREGMLGPDSIREHVEAPPIDLELVPQSDAEKELGTKKDVGPKVTTFFPGGSEFVLASPAQPRLERGSVVENLITTAERLIAAITSVFEGIGAVLRILLMKLLGRQQHEPNPEESRTAGVRALEGLQQFVDILLGVAAVTVSVMFIAPLIAPLLAGVVSWVGGLIGGLLFL